MSLIDFHFSKKGAGPFPYKARGFATEFSHVIYYQTGTCSLQGVESITAAKCSSNCLFRQGVHLRAGSQASNLQEARFSCCLGFGSVPQQAGLCAWQRGTAVRPKYPVDEAQIADKPPGFNGVQGKQLALVWHGLLTCLVYLW